MADSPKSRPLQKSAPEKPFGLNTEFIGAAPPSKLRALYRNLSSSRTTTTLRLTLGLAIRRPRWVTWLGARSAHHGGVHLELAGHALLFSVKHTAGDHELDKVDALRAGGGGNPLTRKPHRSAKAPRTRIAKLRRIALTRLCGIPREEHHVKQLNEKAPSSPAPARASAGASRCASPSVASRSSAPAAVRPHPADRGRDREGRRPGPRHDLRLRRPRPWWRSWPAPTPATTPASP